MSDTSIKYRDFVRHPGKYLSDNATIHLSDKDYDIICQTKKFNKEVIKKMDSFLPKTKALSDNDLNHGNEKPVVTKLTDLTNDFINDTLDEVRDFYKEPSIVTEVPGNKNRKIAIPEEVATEPEPVTSPTKIDFKAKEQRMSCYGCGCVKIPDKTMCPKHGRY